MKKSYILLVAILISCGNTEQRSITAKKDTISVQKDTLVNKNLIERENKKNQIIPQKIFIELVMYMDSLDYHYDTVRVSEVAGYSEYESGSIFYCNGYPFYQLSFNEHIVKRMVGADYSGERLNNDTLYYSDVKKVKKILGYYWKFSLKNSGMVPDGCIEEWEFENEQVAKNANEYFQKNYPWPFFNTRPFYLLDSRFLYIFSSRAMGFSMRNEKFYKWMLKKK